MATKFTHCGVDGIMYDFMIYDVPIHPVESEPDLGASSNVVLYLAKYIPEGKNHLLYFDNWFTSLPLMTHLAKKEIYCLGTVRLNRVKGLTYTNDKDLVKRGGRGTHEEKRALVDDVEVRAVKWMDNQGVHLLSTFASVQPMGECRRYD